MLIVVWLQYRGWAARAREMQKSSHYWARAALALACAAAILGVSAGQAEGLRPIGPMLALLAAAAAAVSPIVGRDILAVGREGKWIRARATAEAIKSECFRFAARLHDYSGPDAAAKFIARIDSMSDHTRKAGVTAAAVDEPYGGPPDAMDAAWYMENRLRDQRAFYSDRQKTNEEWASNLRLVSFGFAVLGALLGVAASFFGQEHIAPWIAVSTTVASSVAAYGLMDRRQFLAASYGAMVEQLDRLERAHDTGAVAYPEIVQAVEDLLSGENRTWADRIAEMPFVPPMPSDTVAINESESKD